MELEALANSILQKEIVGRPILENFPILRSLANKEWDYIDGLIALPFLLVGGYLLKKTFYDRK